MFNINIISTGSQGNCVVVDDHFMMDAGVTKKFVENSGYDLSQLEQLFVSHKHADHTNLPLIRYCITAGIRATKQKKGDSETTIFKGKPQVQVHIPRDVYTKLLEEDKLRINGIKIGLDEFSDRYKNIFIHDEVTEYDHENENGLYHVKLHPQKHYDIINYAITLEKADKRMLYVTDLDTIEPTNVGPGLTSMGMFDTIVMEGNYDEIWLREFIQSGINSIDPDMDADSMNDQELNDFVREHYRQMSKRMAASMFRAVQNMRHLSKQQARAFVREHLNPGGVYYEVHRSSQFYERPKSALDDFLGLN